MSRDLSRLLKPKSIAVIGGGAWCRQVILQSAKMGFAGDIWPVHPKLETIEGHKVYRSITDLPAAPDATFIGVNRQATVSFVGELSQIGAGGAVCFASGFREAQAEDVNANALQDALISVAGDMPILGPNCYGFINYLDNAALWPDQHGGTPVDSGVAIITQSSNIAINLTMQSRALPLAYIVTAGNQAQTGLAEIAQTLLDDPRVTALGLHIEGFGDLRAFEALAATAAKLQKPIIALKVGRSEQARNATISHTASLAGGDAGADALLKRLGIPRVDDLPTFLETLKLLHVTGPLPSNHIASISCSGGEASLAADLGQSCGVSFPALNDRQKTNLRAALGPMVALANPLDYHTYIWRDTPAMTRAFSAMVDTDIALTMLIADFPRPDRCDPADWDCLIDSAVATQANTGGPIAVTTTLPELLPEGVAQRLMRAGAIPFHGLREALSACAAASQATPRTAPPLCLTDDPGETVSWSEAQAKQALVKHGLRVPRSCLCTSPEEAATAADKVGYPVVLKGQGIAHKTEAGAVALNLATPVAVATAAADMPTASYLVEEQITGTLAELLIGVVRDPAHGFVMTLAAGGTWTELMQDSASLLIPATEADIETALSSLRINTILTGYRGAPPANRFAILAAINAVQSYVLEHAATLREIEINPLICTATDAIAADALIIGKAPQ